MPIDADSVFTPDELDFVTWIGKKVKVHREILAGKEISMPTTMQGPVVRVYPARRLLMVDVGRFCVVAPPHGVELTEA